MLDLNGIKERHGELQGDMDSVRVEVELANEEGFCASCDSPVYVRPGCSWELGDVCDVCWATKGPEAHEDRATLIAEVERLRAVAEYSCCDCVCCDDLRDAVKKC